MKALKMMILFLIQPDLSVCRSPMEVGNESRQSHLQTKLDSMTSEVWHRVYPLSLLLSSPAEIKVSVARQNVTFMGPPILRLPLTLLANDAARRDDESGKKSVMWIFDLSSQFDWGSFTGTCARTCKCHLVEHLSSGEKRQFPTCEQPFYQKAF